jgi:hypothetical protein
VGKDLTSSLQGNWHYQVFADCQMEATLSFFHAPFSAEDVSSQKFVFFEANKGEMLLTRMRLQYTQKWHSITFVEFYWLKSKL